MLKTEPARSGDKALAFVASRRSDARYVVLAATFVYGGFIFVPGFHIDDEVSSLYSTIPSYLSLGRWGIALFRWTILPEPFNGFFTTAFAVLSMCVVGILFSSILFKDRLSQLAAAILFVCFPQFCYQIEFHLQVDVVPFGYLFAILTFWCVAAEANCSGWKKCLPVACAVILTILGASIYQPLILVALCMAVMDALLALRSGEGISRGLRPVVVCSIVILLSLPIYVALSRVAIHATGAPNASSYFTDQFAWSRQPYAEVLRYVLVGVPAGVFQGRNFYGEVLYGTAIIPVVFICFTSLRSGTLSCVLQCLLVTAVALLPYSIFILMGSYQPARTFVLHGIVFACLWAATLPDLLEPLGMFWKKISAFVIVAAFVSVSAFFSSRLAFADYIQWKADVSTGTRLLGDIYRNYDFFQAEKTPVFFYGAYQRPNFWHKYNYDAFGWGFFEWGTGDTDRVTAFMTVSGLENLHSPGREERKELTQIALTLPIWPKQGSMLLTDKALIVRIGP